MVGEELISHCILQKTFNELTMLKKVETRYIPKLNHSFLHLDPEKNMINHNLVSYNYDNSYIKIHFIS